MISIKNLTKSYGSINALNSISLEMDSGMIFGYVGPNGAGKSTTINILCGIMRPSSGSVIISNLNMNDSEYKIKEKLGVIPEILPLFVGLTGEEQLNFSAKVYNVDSKEIPRRIDDLLAYFDLSSAKDRPIETYSMGMKKKLAFSCAIIHKPQVLLLDEPFENVDPVSRKKMKDILKKMKETGSTILIASHVLSEVEEFCDEVAIINNGEIVYQSATEKIREKIKNEVTNETYNSLEEIFLDLTENASRDDSILSWI